MSQCLVTFAYRLFFLARCCLSSTLLLFVPGDFGETAVGLRAAGFEAVCEMDFYDKASQSHKTIIFCPDIQK